MLPARDGPDEHRLVVDPSTGTSRTRKLQADGPKADGMELTSEEVDYRTMVGAVIPRPIAWVSSLSSDGQRNLAPFSFFNVATITPPVLSVSVTRYDEQKPDRFKDTLANVRETGEFVINVVGRDQLEAMNQSSARLTHGESEWEAAGVEPAGSSVVEPARVADSPVAFECRLHDTVPVGKSTLVLGDVIQAHVSDDVLTDEDKLDVNEMDLVGRLSAGQYTFIDDRVELERPP
jgi:flavin reductase (DIM6/NTAB) family NADH-FMN oxidoreductase RutF